MRLRANVDLNTARKASEGFSRRRKALTAVHYCDSVATR